MNSLITKMAVRAAYLVQISFLWIWAASAQAQTLPTLIVATENYPPYEMEEAVNGFHGFDYDVAQSIFKRLGFQIDIQFLPWQRAIDSAKRGTAVGILTCAKNKEREKFITFSDPISSFTSGFYVRKNFTGTDIGHLEETVGKSVASLAGYESLKALETAGANPISVINIDRALMMLDSHRFDYLYIGKEPTAFIINQLNMNDTFRYIPLKKQHFYFCFSKAYPGSKQIAERFNRALRQLRKEGVYDRIHHQYR